MLEHSGLALAERGIHRQGHCQITNLQILGGGVAQADRPLQPILPNNKPYPNIKSCC